MKKYNQNITICDARFAKPFDEKLVKLIINYDNAIVYSLKW